VENKRTTGRKREASLMVDQPKWREEEELAPKRRGRRTWMIYLEMRARDQLDHMGDSRSKHFTTCGF